jgi:hypothetical protein
MTNYIRVIFQKIKAIFESDATSFDFNHNELTQQFALLQAVRGAHGPCLTTGNGSQVV